MNIIFQVNGGIGKCVASTAVCLGIKKKYPKANLIVVSGYPDVFQNNPNVYKSLNFTELNYFYQDYIENKKFMFLGQDPYLEDSHIKQECHLIETWFDMFGLSYEKEKPEIHFTAMEEIYYTGKYMSEKPIMVFQSTGGAQKDTYYSWARDLPMEVVQKVIDAFKDEYTIIQIKREDQPKYSNVVPISDTFKGLAFIIKNSKKRLFIDSFAQHTAAAFGLKSTVCWIVNSPKVFGYEVHDNILANPTTKTPDLKRSYLHKFNIGNVLTEFPYNSDSEIFNTEAIIESVLKQ